MTFSSSRFFRPTLLAAFAVCLCLPSASAAVIYDEAVSGDLGGNQGAPVSVGTLVVGTNTFQGSFFTPEAASGQGDGFKVTVGPLHVLTSISLTISDYTGSDPYVTRLYNPSPFTSFQQQLNLTGNQTLNFAIPASLGSELGFSIQRQTSTAPLSFSWRWDVEVAEAPSQVVPEGSSALLVAAGLASLGAWKRFRSVRRS